MQKLKSEKGMCKEKMQSRKRNNKKVVKSEM